MKKVWKSLMKSLTMSLLIMVPGILLSLVHPVLGGMWMLIGSFYMMAKSYRKPWRLSLITSLLPPITIAISYLIQLSIFKDAPSLTFLLGAAIIGVVLGLLRGRTHSVYIEKGTIFAKKSVSFLIIWVVCYGFTQMFALLGRSDYSIGRIGGAFSTSMLAAFCVVLVSKYFKTKRILGKPRPRPALTSIIALLICGTLLIGFGPTKAQGSNSDLAEVLDQLITVDDLTQFGDKIEAGPVRYGNGVAERTFTVYGQERSKKERITGAIGYWTPLTTIKVTLTRHSFPLLPGFFEYLHNKTYYDSELNFNGDMIIHKPQELGFGQYSYIKMTEKGRLMNNTQTIADAAVFQDAWEIYIRTYDGKATGEYVTDANWEHMGYTKNYHATIHLLQLAHGRMDGGLIAAGGLAPDPEAAAIAVLIVSIIFILAGSLISMLNDMAMAGAGAPGTARVPTQADGLPPLIYDGVQLEPNDQGLYQDPVTKQWINRREAERIVAEINAENAARARERAAAHSAHDARANQDWDDLRNRAAVEREIEKRIHDGNLDGADIPDWVKEKWPDLWEQLQAANRLDEFNRREAVTREWLEENHPGTLDKLDNILGRTAASGTVSVEDLESMRNLNQAALDYLQGRNMSAAQYWEGVGHNTDMAEGFIWEMLKAGGTITVTALGAPVILGTFAVGGFVGGYRSWWHDESMEQMAKATLVTGIFNSAGAVAGSGWPDSLIWQASTAALGSATETAVLTDGNIEAIQNAAFTGFIVGTVMHGIAKTASTGITVDNLPTIHGEHVPTIGGGDLDGPDIHAPVPHSDIDVTSAPGVRGGGGVPDGPDIHTTAPASDIDATMPPSVSGRGVTTPDGPDIHSTTPKSDVDVTTPRPRRMDPIVPEDGPFGGDPNPRLAGRPRGSDIDGPDAPRGTGGAPDEPDIHPTRTDFPEDPGGAISGDEAGGPRIDESGGTHGRESSGLFPEETGGIKTADTAPRDMDPIVPQDSPFGTDPTSPGPTHAGIEGPDGGPIEFEQPIPPRNPYQGEGVDPNSGARSIDPNSIPPVQGEAPQLHRATMYNQSGAGEVFDIHGNHIGNLDANGRLTDLNGHPITEISTESVAPGHGGGRIVSWRDSNGNHVRLSEPRIGPNGEVIPGIMATENLHVETSLIEGRTVQRSSWDPAPELDTPGRLARPPDAPPSWDAVGAGPEGQLTGRDGQPIGTIDTWNDMRTVNGEKILSIGMAREGRIPWYRTENGIVWTNRGGPTSLDQARMDIGVGEHPDLVNDLQTRLGPELPPTGKSPPAN